MCTAHLSYGCYIASQIADILGKKAEAEYFYEMRRLTKLAYQETCVKKWPYEK